MANTQTSVPLFVANTVLTAANQNISAGTGVPVFATTVTRDAAFGGSNKALAEGQLCYIEASDVVQYYTGAAWATVGPTASKIAQVVFASTVSTVSTTSTSYVTSGLSATITPTLNTSKIWILSTSANGDGGGRADMYMTLFRGTVSGTNLSATPTYGFGHFGSGAVASEFVFTMNYLDSPATTSSTTYTAGMKVTSNTGYGQYNSAQSNMILVEVLA